MKIAIASDHGGYQLKEAVREYLESRGIEVLDLGTYSEESVDYPAFGHECGEAVVSGKADRGIAVSYTHLPVEIPVNMPKT